MAFFNIFSNSQFQITPPSQTVYTVLAVVLALTVLFGISLMTKVKRAVTGNLIGSVAMFLAFVLTLWYYQLFTLIELWTAMLIGTLIGLLIVRNVKMIQMPQLVGLLNGFGGAASMIAGILTVINGKHTDAFSLITAGLAIVVGALTFTGSIVAAGKLHKVFPQKPIIFKSHQFWTVLTLVSSLVTVPLFALSVFEQPVNQAVLIIIATLLSLTFGVLFSIRVGGADMPITISLLNSLSGVAGAIAGLAIQDVLLGMYLNVYFFRS